MICSAWTGATFCAEVGEGEQQTSNIRLENADFCGLAVAFPGGLRYKDNLKYLHPGDVWAVVGWSQDLITLAERSNSIEVRIQAFGT